MAEHPLGNGLVVEGVGGQLWKIKLPNETVITLRSTTPHMVPAGYEFISPSLDEYTGIMVSNTTQNWNGTTFQCIAFTPANEKEQNSSSAKVVLEVGG